MAGATTCSAAICPMCSRIPSCTSSFDPKWAKSPLFDMPVCSARIGWLLHTGWDILHHLYGNPVLPFDATSSLGCAICDPVIAAWCFAGAPSLYEVIRGKGRYVLQIPAAEFKGRGTTTGTNASSAP